MANFVSIRISNKFEIKAEMTHDFHNSHSRKTNDEPNFIVNNDGSTIEYNRDVIGLTDTKNIYDKHQAAIVEAQSDYKKHHPRALKSNTNLSYAGIITFGRDDGLLSRSEMDNKDQHLLDTNARELLRAFALKNGINIDSTYLVKHCDESMLHYHFRFIAYDFKKHEVMRNRMGPQFLSQLQDLAGKCFEPSGFGRGVKKIDRIDQTLYESGLTLDDYAKMTAAEKSVILKQANVKNKSPKELHVKLKNDALNLKESLDVSLALIDLVQKSSPDEIKALKEEVDADDDKIVKRFFAYALRLHNAEADKRKAIKHLEATITKLDKRKAELEASFRRFAENSAMARLPLPRSIPSAEEKKGTSWPGGNVIIKERDLDKIEADANTLRAAYLELHKEHVAQAAAIAPFAQDIAILHKKLEQAQSDEQHETRLKDIEVALEKGLARFGGDSEMKEMVVKNYQRDSEELLKIINKETRSSARM